MCVRCGTGSVAMCTSPTGHGEQRLPVRCCGLNMNYREVFGIRIYTCDHRSHHPEIFENLYTGERVSDETLEWHEQ
jgi:hypothetical protein